ncbi:WD40 repeat protein [Elasticomyces elasticus]|nr:WD40 repeat protein [Elasticomyces elasticus]
MYWPVGVPQVYAATSQKLHEPQDRTLENDAGSRAGIAETVGGAAEAPPDSAPTVPCVTKEQNLSQAANGKDGTVVPEPNGDEEEIIDARTSRNGHMLVTITWASFTLWQTKPVAVLAVVKRSSQSIRTYGPNVALLLRADSMIIVIQTLHGYLITYSLATDPDACVYQTQLLNPSHGHARQRSIDGYGRVSGGGTYSGPGEGEGVAEVDVRFRMVIKIDAGIAKAIALDEELVVATKKPVAVQCIRWTSGKSGSQTSTELLSRMPWMLNSSIVVEMVYDRPMNLAIWITHDGRAYAVQRITSRGPDPVNPRRLFEGFCFHDPKTEAQNGRRTAVNARFSVIAVGCEDGEIYVYTAKDYTGNIPLSHKVKLSVSIATSGKLAVLSYSPDGYCLFAGFERGWATWSVYGKSGASSFAAGNVPVTLENESWLNGVQSALWIGGGCELLLTRRRDNHIWILEFARSALTGCFCSMNVIRTLLQTSTDLVIYPGQNVTDLPTLSADSTLARNVQLPALYLANQWPIRTAVTSADGRYIAVAGRRGLAHYSTFSGRWKTFDDPAIENEFAVRGGMCWYQHVLVAAVESGTTHQVRLYSREQILDYSNILHVEDVHAPIVHMAMSNEDSLLVYTYENVLAHYLFTSTATGLKLVQVGQIAFHGIIRAPARVRAISWLLPEDQRCEHLESLNSSRTANQRADHGDPSQDVAVASVLFLVDGKLVLLQPSINEHDELKYDMRVIAQNVEYYLLIRDQPSSAASQASFVNPVDGAAINGYHGHGLRDSLWYFDGSDMHLWADVEDVLSSAPTNLGQEFPPTTTIATDYYPMSMMLDKGTIFGIEADLVQRRDVNFAFFRPTSRIHLYLPALLRHHLQQYDSPAALHLSHSYASLPYFPHALEMLLHDVLDEEADKASVSPEATLLPSVLSFLSSFPFYLDIVVQCTRKTELRFWRTLFKYLPPVQELFEESLQKGALKTAGGYLLVLHSFEEQSFSPKQIVKLLARAQSEGEWELCKELARFLVGIDETGTMLREALAAVDMGLARGHADQGDEGEIGPSPLAIHSSNGSLESGQAARADDHAGKGRGFRSADVQGGESGLADDYFTFGVRRPVRGPRDDSDGPAAN